MQRRETTEHDIRSVYCRFQANETMFRYVQKSASPKLIDEPIKQQQTHIRNSASNQVQKRAKRAVIAINTNAPRPTDQACSEWNRDQRGKKSKQVDACSLGFDALRPGLGFDALHQAYRLPLRISVFS